MEKEISINCGTFDLDGLFNKNSLEKAAVITHPHPLYGGTMDNPVVGTVTEELIKKGYSTLRFNFRQVKMQGDDQDSIKDLKAAFDFLAAEGFKENPLLAGYSYGSWINSRAVINGLDISDSIMVSPPVAFIDYKNIKNLPGPGLVITGSEDDIAPPEMVKEKALEWNSDFILKIINRCDHFYGGFLKELKNIVSEYIKH